MEILERIGSGTYGSVYKVSKDGQYYALKIINMEDSRGDYADKWLLETIPSEFIIEVDAYKRFDHPNVLKLINYEINDNQYLLLFELGMMDLEKFIFDPKITKYNVAEIAYQIVSGLLHILNKSIVTSDIKPQNIIVFEDHRVAIFDFGISQINTCAIKEEKWTNNEVYTINFRAPELLDPYEEYEKRHEIAEAWALGIILYELANRKRFYWPNVNGHYDRWLPTNYEKETIDELYKRIYNSLKYQWDSSYQRIIKYSEKNTQLDDLIDGLLQFNPEKRLTVGEAMYHIYFDNVNLNKYYLKPLDNILDCERKLIEQQFFPRMYQHQGLMVKDNIWQNIVLSDFYKTILSEFKSIRLLTIVFQILTRYLDSENPSKDNIRHLLFMIIYFTIKISDRNLLFSNLSVRISNHFNTLPVKDIMDDIFMRLDGRINYTTPIDFVDYYIKSKRMKLEIHKSIYIMVITNMPYKYDSRTIALCAIHLHSEKNNLNFEIPSDKIQEVFALKKQLGDVFYNVLRNEIENVEIID